MDQESLVEGEIVDGRRFLERLVAAGHTVDAAAWIERNNGLPWSLYVATDIDDRDGPLAAIKALASCEVHDDSLVSLANLDAISPRNQIAIDILTLARRHPKRSGFPARIDHVGSLDEVK